MAVDNPFKIKYGTQEVGGTSNSYQLLGPYVIEKTFSTLRLVFDVMVVAASYSGLQSSSDTLETEFRKRDQTLLITINSSVWTYTFGTGLLNSTSSITKSGNEDTDRGYSRSYTIAIEAELPVDDQRSGNVTGLREISWALNFDPGERRTVTCEGVYSATTLRKATANYLHANGADAEATTFLDALSGQSAVFELEDESYQSDRNDHNCSFSRQYVELLVNQSGGPNGTLNDSRINDHQVSFTQLISQPSDSKENTYRLRRVVAVYGCSANISAGTPDLYSLFEDTIKDHIRRLFVANFKTKIYTIEDQRISYDDSSKRISANIQFLYQASSGGDIVEITETLMIREQRVIDYTPVHGLGEMSMYADPGWLILERVATRTVSVIGPETPARRLSETSEPGTAGEIEGIEAGQAVQTDGWNLIQNTSQVSTSWLGDPDSKTQIEMTTLTETVVERFNTSPAGGGDSNSGRKSQTGRLKTGSGAATKSGGFRPGSWM